MQKFITLLVSLIFISKVFATPINIVAAENFYGALAKQIGGTLVQVHSIINNPDADPHLFASSFANVKALNQAQIIIYNGAGYDAWMEQMLGALNKKNITIINVADLMHIKAGANPHIWYQPQTMPTLAKKLTTLLTNIDKAHQNEFKENLITFSSDNQIIQNKISNLKHKFANTWVIATEPVFGYMTDAIGLNMQGLDFQWKIMNDTEPTPQMLANYTKLITDKKVKLLFYNKQVNNATIRNILNLAKTNNIPIVGVTETMPKEYSTVSQWFLAELNDTEKALRQEQKAKK